MSTAVNGRVVAAEYPYVDEAGTTLYVVVRYEPKAFKQKQPDGSGWKWRLDDVRRVPYRLPKLNEAILRGDNVLITEGERDVESAESLGYAATTSAGGSAWKWTPEFVEHFRGAVVTIVADNDEPGRKAARDRAEALVTIAKSVKLIEKLPEVDEKGDISDLIAAGWTREKFDGLLSSATIQEPPPIEDTATLLDELAFTFRRFVHMTAEQADTLAVYVMHTHAFGAARKTPYIYITSAEMRSGKGRTLEVAKQLVRSPMAILNATPAVIYRAVEKWKPTLLIDEVDAVFSQHKSERNEDLRAILNAGFEDCSKIPRMGGKDRDEILEFSPFCPKMLAGIHCRFPNTIRDRSITIELFRKLHSVQLERFGEEREAELNAIRDRLETWALQHTLGLRGAWPEMPAGLTSDRAEDIWRPLVAIADLAGGVWSDRIRHASVVLSGQEPDEESVGIQTLGATRAIFDELAVDRLASAAIAAKLAAIEGGPWTGRYGKDFAADGLAKILRPYKITPKTIRLDSTTAKGYHREDFADAWARYLPPSMYTPPKKPSQPSQPSQVNNDRPFSDGSPVTKGVTESTPTRNATRFQVVADATLTPAQKLSPLVNRKYRGARVTRTQPSQKKAYEISVVTSVTGVTGFSGGKEPIGPIEIAVDSPDDLDGLLDELGRKGFNDGPIVQDPPEGHRFAYRDPSDTMCADCGKGWAYHKTPRPAWVQR